MHLGAQKVRNWKKDIGLKDEIYKVATKKNL
jgi:hypothetical protein